MYSKSFAFTLALAVVLLAVEVHPRCSGKLRERHEPLPKAEKREGEGLDLGFNNAYVAAIYANYSVGLAAANNASGPGRRRRHTRRDGEGIDLGAKRGYAGVILNNYLTGMAFGQRFGRRRRSEERGFDVGLLMHSHVGEMQAKHLMGDAAANNATGPGRKTRQVKRGIDFGLTRGKSMEIQAKHMIGDAAANNASGPGRRRRSEEQNWDLGMYTRNYVGSVQVKHMMGNAAANNATGPGRKRRYADI